MSQHAPNPRAEGSDDPSQDVRHLIDVIFGHFHKMAEWPLVETLRHQLLLADDELDVPSVGRHLDVGWGRVDEGFEGRASLTIHGVALCLGAEEELGDALATVRYAFERFRAAGPGSSFTSEDLVRDLGLDQLRLRRTFELTNWFPGMAGGGRSGDEWNRNLTADMGSTSGLSPWRRC